MGTVTLTRSPGDQPLNDDGFWLKAPGLGPVIFLVLMIYWLWNRQAVRQEEKIFAAKHGCLPVAATVPYKWPFAIDLLRAQYQALPSGRLLEFQTRYLSIAPTLRINILGEGYILTDPVNVEAVLNSRFEDFEMGHRRLGLFPLLGEGIFTQDGIPWRHSREILRRQFVRVREAGLEAFRPHVEELLAAIALEAKSHPRGIVDLQPHFFEYTLGTTTDLLFGEPHSSLPKPERDALRSNFDYASLISAIRLRLANLAWLYQPKRFRDACQGVREWALFFANKGLDYMDMYGEDAAREKYPFIVDLWRDMQDRDLVRDQLLHVLIAGRDTTACLLSWTFFHLVRNPHLIARLQAEIAEVIPKGSKELTRQDLQKLSFLRCCITEALRLYPQLPVNVRFANKITYLPRGGGPDGNAPVLLPKGTGVGWSTYHLHRLESLYGPDARVYRPERWESGELIRKVGLGSGFIDFHGGPRVCLGKDYALTEASYAVVRILQTYAGIRLPPGTPNEPVGAERQSLTIVLSSAEGAKVILRES